MKHLIHTALLAALFAAVFVHVQRTGSGAAGEPSAASAVQPDGEETERIALTVWSSGPTLEYEIEQFEYAHPNVNVTVEVKDEIGLAETYLNALADEQAPDLFIFPQRLLGSFNSTGKLADLSAPPFRLPEGFRASIGEYLWSIHRSLDETRIAAVPFDFYPYVTYYRADLVEKAGFPSDPEQLAERLADPEGWLELAEGLKRQGASITQWPSDTIDVVASGRFMFDRSLSYARSSDVYRAALSVSLQAKPYAANMTIWTDIGQEALRQGKIAMLAMPSWGEGTLEGWLPEQYGRWRAAPLPFGATANDLSSGKSIAVARQSRHMETAADFLYHLLDRSGSVNWYEGAPLSGFLGAQDAGDLYLGLAREQPADAVPTPLDDQAFEIWNDAIDIGIDKGLTLEQTLAMAEGRIMEAVSVDRRQLSSYLGKADDGTVRGE